MGRVGDGGPREESKTHILQHLRQGLVCAFPLLLTCPLPFSLAGSNHCQSSSTQQHQPPFCCHLIHFPGITEIFYLFLFPLLEQLRLDPQCPHAATGMQTSINLQILNRNHLFQNGFGSGVHTLQLSLGHGKDEENKSYVMLSDVRLCPPYIP